MDSSVVTNPITLNNEKFTHLLVLREILLTKSSTQIDIFCHDLLEAFDFNHKLLANILFHGMHKMLYNININMINKCMNKLSSAKSEPEMKTHNANISVIDTKHKKRKKKIFCLNDIPCDVISYCLLQYFDTSTLLSFEKVSKLYLCRARSAVLPAFNFNLSQFLSYTNVSCDLLRFQNTKTLSILFDDDSKNPYFRRRLNNASENNRRNYRRNLRCIHKSQILCQQLSYFANKDRYMPPGVWRKCDKSRNEITQLEWNKLDLILSQFKQYNNLERLTLCCKSEERNESSIINNFMKYLPDWDMLCNLKVLELESVNFRIVNIGMPIGLCELRLTNIVIESNFLQIMNDFMVNLETIYLSNVSIEFEHGLNINIDKLLKRLKHLVFNDAYNERSGVNDNDRNSQLLIELLIQGRINEERRRFNENNLEILHCHVNEISESVFTNGISQYRNLYRLCIDCKNNNHKIVSDIIEKCINLEYLSLVFHPSFIDKNLLYSNSEMFINIFNNFCDSFIVNGRNIKHLRIKEFNPIRKNNSRSVIKHVSSTLIVLLIKYFKNVSKWKKLSSFQFISNKFLDQFLRVSEKESKRLALFANFERQYLNPDADNGNDKTTAPLNPIFEHKCDEIIFDFDETRMIKTIDDLEEFHLLNCLKDMITDELLFTFNAVDASKFVDLNGLNKFCNKPKHGYHIKICGSQELYTCGQLWSCDGGWTCEGIEESNRIKIQIGKWNDQFDRNKFGHFDQWKYDCSVVDSIPSRM